MFGCHPFHSHRHMRRGDREEHGYGRHHGRFGGGRSRVFDQGDLRLIILHLVGEKPRHGYELIKAIEEKLGGAYSPSPGIVYPTLTLLEELGHVALGPSEGSRKLYAITQEGEAHLAENRAAVDAILARMNDIGAREHSTPVQLLRAMENLKLALKLRLSRGVPDEEKARAIAAILDRAASEIEEA